MNNKKIAILGSTGSVGRQTVEVAAELGAAVTTIAAAGDFITMEKQARLLRPKRCVMENEEAAKELRVRLADTSVEVAGGHGAVLDAAADSDADIIFNLIGGSAGLEPTLVSAKAGKTIALSNKESIVMAGELVTAAIKQNGASIIPVDSEHSAIFQCLRDGNPISRILLTASGGPFFGMSREVLADITPERALAHPTWNMGAKITIDSATLMNKGFEVIEAVHLFGVLPEQVEVVVHRESIIHSMVEYTDNAVLAQLSVPDMRLCAQYAMTYPRRVPGLMERLDLKKIGRLTFFEPDTKAFPLLSAAYDAIREGGIVPAALVCADEAAVEAFMRHEIGFNSISDVVLETMTRLPKVKAESPEAIIAAAEDARTVAAELCKKLK